MLKERDAVVAKKREKRAKAETAEESDLRQDEIVKARDEFVITESDIDLKTIVTGKPLVQDLSNCHEDN